MEVTVPDRMPLALEYGIGTLVQPETARFPGLRMSERGFGADMPPTFEAALLATVTKRPPPPRFIDTTRFQSETVREQYGLTTRTHYAESGLPLGVTRYTDVQERVQAIQPERVYVNLSFVHVQHNEQRPEELTLPTLEVGVSWRHTTFARMIIGERLPYLRTTELADSAIVWRRILELFANYCTMLRRETFQLLEQQDHKREMTALYFAAYEQFLSLRCEAALQQPRFRSAISERVHEGSQFAERILELETKFDTKHHVDRLRARQERYLQVLDDLINLTANGLMTHVPHGKRS